MNPTSFIADGRIHRLKGESGNSAWYVSHGTWGAWGDWATGEKHTFCNGILDKEKMKTMRRDMKKIETEMHKETAAKCLDIWENKANHVMRHNYLVGKQVEEYTVKWYGNDLLIPVCDIHGKIWNLQKINARGQKYFVKDGKKKGCMFRMGSLTPNTVICEGYATGASIHQITGLAVIVAFDAYNLYEVCRLLVRKYSAPKFYIALDDDRWKPHAGNTGEREAMKCYSDFHVGLIKPVFKNPTVGKPTDFNDMHVREGAESVYRQFKFLL